MDKLDCVVSLTTWKGRINDPKLPRVLYRILNQKTNFNYKVVLVLSKEEFGENYKLPDVLEFLTFDEKFEILWTDKNTKALKKLDPTMEKYPDVPIITLDDDELVSVYAVEAIMTDHKETPDMILGGLCGPCNNIIRVSFIRLFPPNSLANIPSHYFGEYFQYTNDDEWNGLRAALQGTKSRRMKYNVVENMEYGDQSVAFKSVYNKFNFSAAVQKFRKDHPEYFK